MSSLYICGTGNLLQNNPKFNNLDSEELRKLFVVSVVVR